MKPRPAPSRRSNTCFAERSEPPLGTPDVVSYVTLRRGVGADG